MRTLLIALLCTSAILLAIVLAFIAAIECFGCWMGVHDWQGDEHCAQCGISMYEVLR